MHVPLTGTRQRQVDAEAFRKLALSSGAAEPAAAAGWKRQTTVQMGQKSEGGRGLEIWPTLFRHGTYIPESRQQVHATCARIGPIISGKGLLRGTPKKL